MNETVVERRAGVVGGKPVVAGTRMPASVIIRESANGLTPAMIAEHYPAVTEAQVVAALDWAAEQVGEARWLAAAE